MAALHCALLLLAPPAARAQGRALPPLAAPTVEALLRDDVCRRLCAEAFGEGSEGRRASPEDGTRCACRRDGESLGSLARLEPAESVPLGEGVCGADGRTYPSAEAARGRTTPLHGGSCGACSNPGDIAVYRRTAGSLTELARACAAAGVLFGERAAAACLRLGAGLSPACNDCWAANMNCTAARCLEPCLRRLGGPHNDELGALNECLACDERLCGPAFIRCAGANRRRSGIGSDIRRPPEEVWVPRPL